MKRIEVHHNQHAGELQYEVYQITWNGRRASLLCACLTEEIANKVKQVLEK